MTLTGQKQAGQRDHVKLLYRDVIAVHEQVQQINSQVSGRRTQLEAIADYSDKVCKISSKAQLWGLAFVRRQPQLLKDIQRDNHTAINMFYNTDLCNNQFKLHMHAIVK